MEKINRVTAVIMFFFSLGICIESIRLSLGKFQHPGPGFFPFLFGTIIGVSSVVLFLKNRMKGEKTARFWEAEANRNGLFLVIFGLVAYALLFETLGFLVSSVLFFTFIGRFLTHKKWIITIPLAIFISIVAYLIFQTWLHAQLPRGILG
jgi:putative tricarboxylic transport membrane protein